MARTSPITKSANTKLTSTEYNDQLILNLQHLLAYTLDGVDLDTIVTPLEIHNFTERVAPGTPSSNVVSMYADTADSVLKVKYDTGEISYWGESFFTRKVTLNANGEFNITLADYEEAAGATAMEIWYRLRSATVAVQQNLNIRFNGETALTNYYRQVAGAQGGAAGVTYGNDQVIDTIPGVSSPANSHGYGRLIIFNLEAGDAHVVDGLGGSRYNTGSGIRRNSQCLVWDNTAAITTIQIRCTSTTDILSGGWIKFRFLKEAF